MTFMMDLSGVLTDRLYAICCVLLHVLCVCLCVCVGGGCWCVVCVYVCVCVGVCVCWGVCGTLAIEARHIANIGCITLVHNA
jgi:hypothetical protein